MKMLGAVQVLRIPFTHWFGSPGAYDSPFYGQGPPLKISIKKNEPLQIFFTEGI